MKLTRYDVALWLVVIAMFLAAWQPADAVTPVTERPAHEIFFSAIGAGDYYWVTCPDAGDICDEAPPCPEDGGNVEDDEVCDAGGSGITPIRRPKH